ncbi:MAG: hypothetical protein FJX74_18890, partial [Armatimonadetes bacterium]|nr:hypothetical protein [Armatimonadota bacterium]
MPGRMTRDDLVTVLLNRYPTREELERLPLGRHHLELDARVWTKASRPIDLAEPDALLTRSDDLGEQEENRKQILEKLEADGLIAKTEKLGEVYRHHMLSLMKGVRAIVTGDLGSICEAGFDPYETRPSKELDVLPLTCAPFANLGRSHAHAAERLLLTALYHDVGKAVHRDAHGRLGWHMLQ